MHPNRFKVYGGVMLFIGVVIVLIGVANYNSMESQLSRAFGVINSDILVQILIGLVVGIWGIVMLAAPPKIFQRLNGVGLIVFTLLVVVFFPLCWVPWWIRKLKISKESLNY